MKQMRMFFGIFLAGNIGRRHHNNGIHIVAMVKVDVMLLITGQSNFSTVTISLGKNIMVSVFCPVTTVSFSGHT